MIYIAKKLNWFLVTTLLASLTLVGCSKKDPQLKEEGELPQDFKDSNLGHYSGVMVGSTGYYNLLLRTSGAKATVLFDGKKYELQRNSPISARQRVENLRLSDGNLSIIFNVDEEGKNPNISISIPGHTIAATIAKWEENNFVTNYIGSSKSTYLDATDVTTYNMTVKGDTYQVIGKNDDGTYTETGKIMFYEDNRVKIISKETTIEANHDPATGNITHFESGPDNFSLEIKLNRQQLLFDESGNPNEEYNWASPTMPPGG